MRKRSVRTLSTHPFAAEDELAFLRCAWDISLAPVGSFAEAMRRYTAQEKRIFLRCYIHVGNLYWAELYRVNRTNSGLINFRSTEYEDPDGICSAGNHPDRCLLTLNMYLLKYTATPRIIH